MNNLFSIFDPIRGTVNLPINWARSCIAVILLPTGFWLVSNRYTALFKSIREFLCGEFNAILGRKAAPGTLWILIRLLIFIMVNNAFGLLPYVFTRSSHLSFALTLSLPLWLGHVIMSWVKQPVPMLAHLVPLGTPYALMPFIVIIELIRRLIGPGTLAVRLAANMVAGHLLLTLIGSIAPRVGALILICVLGGLVLLMTLECAVALIQSYVFTILITLYVEEVSSKKIAL